MNARILLLAIMGLAVAGCNSQGNTRASPELAPQAASQQPAKKNLLEEVGATTVRIVQEPMRMVTPAKAQTEKPEVFEAPAIKIRQRGYSEPVPAATPAAAPPATSPPRQSP
jgi:hypothetical protein